MNIYLMTYVNSKMSERVRMLTKVFIGENSMQLVAAFEGLDQICSCTDLLESAVGLWNDSLLNVAHQTNRREMGRTLRGK